MTSRSDHYSYRHYANAHVASDFDDLRFGGPIGQLVAESQEHVLLQFLGDVTGRAVLDVGTGTGRAALALARRGAVVTGVDASKEMLRLATERAKDADLAVQFLPGDAHALQFADRAFDAVVCFRLLMHAPDWRRCLGELCRVARECVVVDYPAACSFAALQASGRRVAYAAGARTEPYRVFADATIAAALQQAGFSVTDRHKQFVLPIAVHKRLGSRWLTERIERALGKAGVTHRFGSPVTVVAQRRDVCMSL